MEKSVNLNSTNKKPAEHKEPGLYLCDDLVHLHGGMCAALLVRCHGELQDRDAWTWSGGKRWLGRQPSPAPRSAVASLFGSNCRDANPSKDVDQRDPRARSEPNGLGQRGHAGVGRTVREGAQPGGEAREVAVGSAAHADESWMRWGDGWALAVVDGKLRQKMWEAHTSVRSGQDG
jgi:hypothetical protein